MSTLRELFDQEFAHLKYDNRLAKQLNQFQIDYVNRNHEHLEFFGSNLLGVHVIRFKDSDLNRFFDEILNVDYLALTDKVRRVTTINHSYKVSSDVFNLTCMYLIHKYLSNSTITEDTRHRASYDIALVFFYRCIAALISAWFKYPTDPQIAQQAYANLSQKFLIKKLGSWHRVMDYRTTDLMDRKGLHYKTLYQFKDDYEIVQVINDAQGRIRDLVKNYYSEFMKVHAEGSNISVVSGTMVDAEGEETIREKTKSVESFVSYMRHAVIDKHTFIKDELVSLIVKINVNTSFRMVKHTLSWLSENFNDPKSHKEIDDFITKVIVQSMHYIQHNVDAKHERDFGYILVTLKNLYLSTRTVDKDVEEIRDLGYKLVQRANGKLSTSLILSTRTSIILYITLRALIGKTGHH